MITEFQGKYRFLSNFYPCYMIYDNIEFKNAEAAYQAAKTTDIKLKAEIANLLKPGDAKRYFKLKQNCIRQDFHDIKLNIMKTIVSFKFNNNPELKQLLLSTNNEILQEGNYWGDKYWGVDLRTHSGQNHLGKIIMNVRDEIKIKRMRDD